MRPKFVAEICSNHNGDPDRARALIEAAGNAGCWGVKFQLFRIDKLFAPEILSHPDYRERLNARRAWELPLDWLPVLAEAAHREGLKFGCTPFYLGAVDQLAPYVDFFKVASYELPWYPLLDKVMDTGKPVVLSTGMATLEEIKAAVHRQQTRGQDTARQLTLLHCVSQYPTRPEYCHLAQISRLRSALNGIAGVGWSDHSVNEGVIFRAAYRYNAEMIEFHLDLDDRKGAEYNQGHCWGPWTIRGVIRQIKAGLRADGDLDYSPDYLERDFRTDPEDGLRPPKDMRARL